MVTSHTPTDQEPTTHEVFPEEPGPSWVASTPYYRHFREIRDRNVQQLDVPVSNRYYAPDFVAYILRIFMAILPLWTALSIAGSHDTNNIVEN